MLKSGRCNGYAVVCEFRTEECRVSVFAQNNLRRNIFEPVAFQIKVQGRGTYNLHGRMPLHRILSAIGDLPKPSSKTDKLFGHLSETVIQLTAHQAAQLGQNEIRSRVVMVDMVGPRSPLQRYQEYRLATLAIGREHTIEFDGMETNGGHKPIKLGSSIRKILDNLGAPMPETHEEACELFRQLGNLNFQPDRRSANGANHLGSAENHDERRGPRF